MKTKVINGCTFIIPSCHTDKNEVSPQLREMIANQVRKDAEIYGSAFDAAVDISYDWGLVSAEEEWEIPQYVVEIAEEVMGAD